MSTSVGFETARTNTEISPALASAVTLHFSVGAVDGTGVGGTSGRTLGAAVTGRMVVGANVVGGMVVGESVVGGMVLGDKVVGGIVLGDMVFGGIVVGDTVLGDLVGDLVDFFVGLSVCLLG